ncbi:hypothetical protein Y1Q_0004189 [Alligator mississippiensis]|uniref:Uncharacterized protein n=1 Tax=Alligator mississippiensis TaxID=8496 RepID=A0A151PIM3_ALLMI|nr:hypothetical protein Y1Q_0004189 [Alligator mississippiensis]
MPRGGKRKTGIKEAPGELGPETAVPTESRAGTTLLTAQTSKACKKHKPHPYLESMKKSILPGSWPSHEKRDMD